MIRRNPVDRPHTHHHQVIKVNRPLSSIGSPLALNRRSYGGNVKLKVDGRPGRGPDHVITVLAIPLSLVHRNVGYPFGDWYRERCWINVVIGRRGPQK